jgi:hypothetical protein
MLIGFFNTGSNILTLAMVLMATHILMETSTEEDMDTMVKIMGRPCKSLRVKKMNFYTALQRAQK